MIPSAPLATRAQAPQDSGMSSHRRGQLISQILLFFPGPSGAGPPRRACQAHVSLSQPVPASNIPQNSARRGVIIRAQTSNVPQNPARHGVIIVKETLRIP